MQAAENKMGVMPINRLIINMSLPMVVSMLVMALYNIVDSMFVSWISEEALTAVSTAFPLQNLIIAVATGTGVGLNALISKSLGEKQYDRASQLAKNGVFLAACSFVVFLLVGIFCVKPFFMSQTENELIVKYGIEYTTIVLTLSFGSFFEICFERLMQATGRTFYSMVTQIIGAVVNIIFDPIFIFTFKMGVAGAAYATVLGQIAAAVAAFIINKKCNSDINLSFRGFKPSAKLIAQIYKIGIPSIIMSSIGSVMYYGVNKILIAMNETASAVFGVYFKLQSFIFMPIFGLNNGIIPIIGFNYGAANRKRIIKTLKLGVLYSVVIMAVGTLLFQLFPDMFFAMFRASEHMLKMGRPALRIASLAFIVAGVDIVFGSLFQAFGFGVMSMMVSITRQLIVLLPCAFLLSLTGNVDAVWWAFPISEAASLLVSFVFYIHINKKVISKIPDGRE